MNKLLNQFGWLLSIFTVWISKEKEVEFWRRDFFDFLIPFYCCHCFYLRSSNLACDLLQNFSLFFLLYYDDRAYRLSYYILLVYLSSFFTPFRFTSNVLINFLSLFFLFKWLKITFDIFNTFLISLSNKQSEDYKKNKVVPVLFTFLCSF